MDWTMLPAYVLIGVSLFCVAAAARSLFAGARERATQRARPAKRKARRLSLDAGLIISQLVDEGHGQALADFAISGYDLDCLMADDATAYLTLENAGLLPITQETRDAITIHA